MPSHEGRAASRASPASPKATAAPTPCRLTFLGRNLAQRSERSSVKKRETSHSFATAGDSRSCGTYRQARLRPYAYTTGSKTSAAQEPQRLVHSSRNSARMQRLDHLPLSDRRRILRCRLAETDHTTHRASARQGAPVRDPHLQARSTLMAPHHRPSDEGSGRRIARPCPPPRAVAPVLPQQRPASEALAPIRDQVRHGRSAPLRSGSTGARPLSAMTSATNEVARRNRPGDRKFNRFSIIILHQIAHSLFPQPRAHQIA